LPHLKNQGAKNLKFQELLQIFDAVSARPMMKEMFLDLRDPARTTVRGIRTINENARKIKAWLLCQHEQIPQVAALLCQSSFAKSLGFCPRTTSFWEDF
jgi:hypothetical protein